MVFATRFAFLNIQIHLLPKSWFSGCPEVILRRDDLECTQFANYNAFVGAPSQLLLEGSVRLSGDSLLLRALIGSCLSPAELGWRWGSKRILAPRTSCWRVVEWAVLGDGGELLSFRGVGCVAHFVFWFFGRC